MTIKLAHTANGHLTKETTKGKELTYICNSEDRLPEYIEKTGDNYFKFKVKK